MILYSAYFFFLSMILLQTSAYFNFIFKALGVSPGDKTVAIQCASVAIASIMLIRKSLNKLLLKDLLLTTTLWALFLGYTAICTNFAEPYASVKFAKLFVIQYLSSITIAIAYFTNRNKFNSYLSLSVIFFAALLGIEAIINPKVFTYRTVIERLTIEDVNPIWLARTFAYAGLCIYFLPVKSKLVKILGVFLCVFGIIPTESRGPLISLIMVITAHWLAQNKNKKYQFILQISAAVLSLIFSILIFGPSIDKTVTNYFSRNQQENMLEESGRPQLFATALHDLASSPLTGVGLGKYGSSRPKIISTQQTSNQGFYPHNIILEMLSELGILGTTLFILALRPGKWIYATQNKNFYLFLLALLFSMTSGDVNGNTGLFIFSALARLSYKYPTLQRNEKILP